MKNKLSFLITLIIFLYFQPHVTAADFTTYYKITYEVLEKGETQVTQETTIKNLTQKIFASEYNISIFNMKPYDIEASDSKGIMAVCS